MLKRYRLAFLLTVLLLECLFLISLQFLDKEKKNYSPEEQHFHLSHFYQKEPFEKAFREASGSALPTKVYGGIVPHHLLTSSLIASFFKGIEQQEVETVVLLGPNHKNLGKPRIALSKACWQTPYGILEPNLEVADKLLSSRVAYQEEAIFEDEHSIYSLTTFIKKAFPQTRFLPIVFMSFTNVEEAKKLGLELSRILGDKTLVLASVDFSHDVSLKVAENQDQQSIKVLEEFNFEKIYDLETDSNSSLYALLSFLSDRGAKTATLLENSNSALIGDSNFDSLTSYVTMYFTKELPLAPSLLNFDRIFSSNHKVEAVPQGEFRTLVVTGDILLARSVNYQMHQRRDFDYPFEKTGEFLRSADLTFINLENPLLDDCPLTNEGMVLCGSPKAVEGLVSAGIDVVNLANNHAKDWGDEGLKSTMEILDKNNIAIVGLGKLLIKEVRGLKFAFLGYDLVKTAVDEAKILSQLKEAKSLADVAVVYFHWGIEYTDQPTQSQRNLAHLVINSGADLVIGSHPHWIQGVEIYRNKLIVYSHGNFIFDQIWSEETRGGIVGRYTFYSDQLVDVEFLPVFMKEFAQPRFLSGGEKQAILDEMKQKGIID